LDFLFIYHPWTLGQVIWTCTQLVNVKNKL
jgi:hypothetical protein